MLIIPASLADVMRGKVKSVVNNRVPLKIQVSKQDKARVKNLSAAYSWYVSDNFFRVTPYCDETV